MHTHGYRPDVIDAPVARRMGVPTVTTVHGFTGGGWRGRFYEWLQVRSFRAFDAVVPVSRKLEGELAARGVPGRRLHLLRNAWKPSTPFLDRVEARRLLGIGSEAPDVMIRALAEVGAPDVRLSMIGAGPMESECRVLAETLGVNERVRWHGMVPDAGSVLRAFDALTLSSWTEGTPMVLLEAMAAGVPIVTTTVGGVPDVVTPAEARHCAAGEPGQIAEAIDDVFHDPESATTRARAAKRRLETDFAVGPWVERHRALYYSLMAS
jgi:glycosyltransferase involved in cell wall biosynthesis